MDRDLQVIIIVALIGTILGGAFIASSITLNSPDNSYEDKYSQELNYTENQHVESITDKQFSAVAELNNDITQSKFNSTVNDIENTGVTIENRSYEDRTVQVETTPKQLQDVAKIDAVERLDVP